MNKIKRIACAALAAAALILGTPAQAQPAPGYDSTPVVIKTGVWWTNRVAGSTSTTNWYRIDVSQMKVGVAVEMLSQGTAAAGSGTAVLLGRSITPSYADATNNVVETFAAITNTLSATALTTVGAHTNFVNIQLGGYPYLWVGPLTNASATGANYITNVVVYVRVQ